MKSGLTALCIVPSDLPLFISYVKPPWYLHGSLLFSMNRWPSTEPSLVNIFLCSLSCSNFWCVAHKLSFTSLLYLKTLTLLKSSLYTELLAALCRVRRGTQRWFASRFICVYCLSLTWIGILPCHHGISSVNNLTCELHVSLRIHPLHIQFSCLPASWFSFIQYCK